MRRLQLLVLIALSAIGALASVSSASAAPGDPWQYEGSFGEGLGVSTFGNIAVNHQTGHVLVMGNDGNIHQFDASGSSLAFPATGSSQIAANGKLVLANGGGATQGNFYVWDGASVYSYKADGSLIGVYQPLAEGVFNDPDFLAMQGGIFVGADGTLWVFDQKIGPSSGYENAEVVAVTPEMDPIGPRGETSGAFIWRGPPPVLDSLGTLYADSGEWEVTKFDANNGFARLPNVNLSVGGEVKQLAIDPSNNDLYRAADQADFTFGSVGYVTAAHPGATSGTPPIQVLNPQGGLRRAGGIGFDGSGQTMYVSENGRVRVFHRAPPRAPWGVAETGAKEVRAFSARLEASMIDGGADTTYRFEYGLTDSYGSVSDTFTAPHRYFRQAAGGVVRGLEQNTTYHFRIVATNSAGTTYGPDGVFRTYQLAGGADSCPNALARKQTIASRLPDCRAYELVSAADTGGYDVESYLAPGQTPFPGFPMATDKLLYATHSGAVPGPWNATNKGPDPYVATRTSGGWVTDYKGFPSDLNPEAGSFSSVLGEADSKLNNLAFVGPNLCNPCFTDGGLRTGIPVRTADGKLIQGMSGSLAGSVPNTAKPEGKVAKYFSEDGNHLLFASKYAFEPGANSDGSTLTVYDRNLNAGTTQIVSTDASGNPLTGTVSQLDVSANGSRVVSATKTGEDAQGNELVHPWMHIGSAPNGVDLAPGTTTGVLFAGMTSDGSKVFFTSKDKLDGADTDSSADLYEAAVDGSGNVELSVITGENDSDACNPVANTNGEHWNSTTGTADCSVVAISGGGGVASASGAIYFLSPETFGGEGTPNQPNLYLAQPGGSPDFVATLEPDNLLVLDSVKANAVRRTGDFQVTPSGGYAAFTSTFVLAGLHTGGFVNVYRFSAGSGELDCGSCDRTGSEDSGVFANAGLPPSGLGLLEDGRLFFTTAAQLLLNDANGVKDVYEWNGGNPQLISAGTGPFDSALLSASANGTDVFFFTHDNLATEEDKNGALMRIYDAREGGGFFKLPPPVPCQASDECHGPGTPTPGPSDIKSSGKTTPGNVLVCPKNRVKKRGHCVKKPAQRKHKKKAKKRKGAAKKRAASTTGKRGGRNA